MDKIKEIFNKNKKALIGLGVAVLVYAGYTFFMGGDESSDLSLGYSPASPSAVYDLGIGQSILKTLNELRRIKFEVLVFDDPVFKSLTDHKVSTTTLPLGRIDPFAPTRDFDE